MAYAKSHLGSSKVETRIAQSRTIGHPNSLHEWSKVSILSNKLPFWSQNARMGRSKSLLVFRVDFAKLPQRSQKVPTNGSAKSLYGSH